MGIHVSLVHEIISDMCISYYACIFVTSEIIEFQTQGNPSRVKTLGANIPYSFDKVDALLCLQMEIHISLRHEIISYMCIPCSKF